MEFNKCCAPNSNNDLCLLFCVNPSSVAVSPRKPIKYFIKVYAYINGIPGSSLDNLCIYSCVPGYQCAVVGHNDFTRQF